MPSESQFDSVPLLVPGESSPEASRHFSWNPRTPPPPPEPPPPRHCRCRQPASPPTLSVNWRLVTLLLLLRACFFLFWGGGGGGVVVARSLFVTAVQTCGQVSAGKTGQTTRLPLYRISGGLTEFLFVRPLSARPARILRTAAQALARRGSAAAQTTSQRFPNMWLGVGGLLVLVVGGGAGGEGAGAVVRSCLGLF